jgi:hypothetical protein
MAPLCFVLMPFGQKPDSTGAIIDFDRVYTDLMAPAISAAGLEPLRADKETIGGIIHKPMFERLILCPYAVADPAMMIPRKPYRPVGSDNILRGSLRLPASDGLAPPLSPISCDDTHCAFSREISTSMRSARRTSLSAAA